MLMVHVFLLSPPWGPLGLGLGSLIVFSPLRGPLVCMCAQGRMEWWWNDCLQTMTWKQWLKFKLLMLLCVLHCLPGALVVRLCVCSNSYYFFICVCGEW